MEEHQPEMQRGSASSLAECKHLETWSRITPFLQQQCARLRRNDPKLTKLNICHGLVGDDGARLLGESIAHTTFLQELFLNDNRICEAGYAALARGLAVHTSIRKLHLGGNILGNEGALAFRDALCTNNTLTELWLDNEVFGRRGDVILLEGVGRSRSLRALHLSRVRLHREGYRALKRALSRRRQQQQQETSQQQLQVLSLSKTETTGEEAAEVARGLQHNTSVRRLDLRCNNIGLEGAVALGEMLAYNTTLTELNLSNNQIQGAGANALFRGLRRHNNTALVKLDLSQNFINDDCAVELEQFLSRNRSLKDMSLMSNLLGDEAAEALGAGLAQNATLLDLDLSNNQMGDTGLRHIATALQRHNKTISRLAVYRQNVAAPQGRLDQHRIDIYARLNEAARRLVEDISVPVALLPRILAQVKYEPDLLFYFLSQRPDLFLATSKGSAV